VIHLDGFGLVLLGKTCRLCLRCDTLVAHKAELDTLLRSVVNVAEPEYVVLGTLERHVYRRGLSTRVSLNEVKDHMADFKSYWKIQVTPAGRYPKTEIAG
jgi:hypothetical protein